MVGVATIKWGVPIYLQHDTVLAIVKDGLEALMV
jgi:hypothetical protein